MNNKYKELVRLINMMTEAEKRGFTTALKDRIRGEGKNYPVALIIFNILDQGEEFSEQQFLKKLKKAIPNPEQQKKVIARLPVERRLLYERLMRFLRNANGRHYPSIHIKELIADAKILMERGLFDLAQQELDRARAKALEIDSSLAILEINREERTLVYTNITDGEKRKKRIEYLIKEAEEYRGRFEQESYYQDLYERANTNLTKGPPMTAYRKKLVEEIMQEERHLDQLNQLPGLSGNRLVNTFAWLTVSMDETRHLSRYYQLHFQWWEDHQKQMIENPYRYMLSMGNIMSQCIDLQDNATFVTVRDRMKKALIFLPHRELAEFRFINRRLFSWYLNNKELDKARELTKVMEAGMKKFSTVLQLEVLIGVESNILSLNFICGNFRDALVVVKRSKRFQNEPVMLNVQYMAALLGLICVYETTANEISTAQQDSDDRGDPLKSHIRRIHRFFQQHALSAQSLEMTVLEFLKKIVYADVQVRTVILTEMKNYLTPYTQKASGKTTFGVHELMMWLESQLQHKPIRQVQMESEYP